MSSISKYRKLVENILNEIQPEFESRVLERPVFALLFSLDRQFVIGQISFFDKNYKRLFAITIAPNFSINLWKSNSWFMRGFKVSEINMTRKNLDFLPISGKMLIVINE